MWLYSLYLKLFFKIYSLCSNSLKLRICSLVMWEGVRFHQYDSSYVNIQNLKLSYIVCPLINSKPITDPLGNGGKVTSETRSNMPVFPGKHPVKEKTISLTQLNPKEIAVLFTHCIMFNTIHYPKYWWILTFCLRISLISYT